jgi:hypothetical protein
MKPKPAGAAASGAIGDGARPYLLLLLLLAVQVGLYPAGYIRSSLRSTAQPLYTTFTTISSRRMQ